jgi:hypothetical protein
MERETVLLRAELSSVDAAPHFFCAGTCVAVPMSTSDATFCSQRCVAGSLSHCNYTPYALDDAESRATAFASHSAPTRAASTTALRCASRLDQIGTPSCDLTYKATIGHGVCQ